MKRMIYCRKKEHILKDMAIYDFGISTENMSGVVKFYSDQRAFEVTALPKGENVSKIILGKLYTKYQKKFEENNFPEKLSFEC